MEASKGGEMEKPLSWQLADAFNSPNVEYGLLPDVIDDAEAEIARRGLQADYLIALTGDLGFNLNAVPVSDLPPLLWALLTAPPDVRARAMLRALEG
jgi:hypothetical protein